MNPKHKKFIYPLLAPLGLMFSPLSLSEAFTAATLLGAGVLGTVYLFEILRCFFPKRVLRPALVLFIAAVFQCVHTLISMPPFWLVSFALLLDWKDFEKSHLASRPLPPLVRVGIFWCAVLWLAGIRQILALQLGLGIFEQPSGVLLALSFFSCWILASEKPLEPLWRVKRSKT